MSPKKRDLLQPSEAQGPSEPEIVNTHHDIDKPDTDIHNSDPNTSDVADCNTEQGGSYQEEITLDNLSKRLRTDLINEFSDDVISKIVDEYRRNETIRLTGTVFKIDAPGSIQYWCSVSELNKVYKMFSASDHSNKNERISKLIDKCKKRLEEIRADELSNSMFVEYHELEKHCFYYSALGVLYESLVKLEVDPIDSRSSSEIADANTRQSSRTSQLIDREFGAVHEQGWRRIFLTENDYISFRDILVKHFEQKAYELPFQPIKVNKHSKTKLSRVLGNLQTELSNIDIYSRDLEFFKVVRMLEPFSNIKDAQLYKDLRR